MFGEADVTDDWAVGEPVDWQPAAEPERIVLEGRSIRVEPLRVESHGESLWRASHGTDCDPKLWHYLAYGPFSDQASFREHLERQEASDDPLFFALVDPVSGEARGVAALMRIDAVNGVGEVGHIWFGSGLQRTTAATEGIFLLGDYLMTTLGYRRFEWKCDSLNRRSRRAAERYGFAYEGTFRQHMFTRGRNRDTSWYAVIDRDWPRVRAGFLAWLDPANFDADGRQIRSIEDVRGPGPA